MVTKSEESDLLVVLTIPIHLDRKYTIGELTQTFELAVKDLMEDAFPGSRLNRATDVELRVDKFPDWKKECCGPHALPNVSCDCACHDNEE